MPAPQTFKYQPRDAASWDKRANQSASKYANVIKDEFFQFSASKDENSIRILPPTWENPGHYGFDVYVHFGVGPDNGTVICLSKMRGHAPAGFGIACPICEYQVKAETAGREDAGDFKAKRRVLVWVINRKEVKLDENPQIWTMPWTLDKEISMVCKDRETGQLYQIDNPESGYDVFFNKTGEKELTKYSGVALSRRESAIDNKYLAYVIEHPAPSTLLWRSYEEVTLLFGGEVTPAEAAEKAAGSQTAPGPYIVQPAQQQTTAPAQSSAPAQVVEAAQVQAVTQCTKEISFRGERLRCAFVAEHAGDCDYAMPVSTPPVPEPAAAVAPQPEPVRADIAPKANGLRQRFETAGGVK